VHYFVESIMNIRNATLAIRHRRDSLFEQEHAASRDYDKQRSGGTPSKPPGKKDNEDGSKSKPKKGSISSVLNS
jgi:hypothetical protein